MKKLPLLVISIALVVVAGSVGLLLRRSSLKVDTLERGYSLHDMVTEADLIVYGVVGRGSTWTDAKTTDRPLVFTDWEFMPQEAWKGTPPTPLKVTVLGGENLAVRVEEETPLKFSAGFEALLFLRFVPETQRWVPLSVNQTVLRKQGSAYVDAHGKSYEAASLRQEVQRVQK